MNAAGQQQLSLSLLSLIASVTWGQLVVGVSLFLGMFLLSLLAVGVIIISLPATVFLERQRRSLWIDQHPVIRWTGIAAKNISGLGLVGLGVLLLFLPGQGILTILIGLLLMDFPGKRKLERRLLGRPRVLKAANRLRARFGRAPFVLELCP